MKFLLLRYWQTLRDKDKFSFLIFNWPFSWTLHWCFVKLAGLFSKIGPNFFMFWPEIISGPGSTAWFSFSVMCRLFLALQDVFWPHRPVTFDCIMTPLYAWIPLFFHGDCAVFRVRPISRWWTSLKMSLFLFFRCELYIAHLRTSHFRQGWLSSMPGMNC